MDHSPILLTRVGAENCTSDRIAFLGGLGLSENLISSRGPYDLGTQASVRAFEKKCVE